MKRLFGFLTAAFLGISTTATAVTIDGTLDTTEYGTPLATQTLGTSFGDSDMGASGAARAANGSELDAAYGFISNSVMYLFLAGNLQGGTNNVFNKFEIFIDSIPGQGQNMLTNNNNGVDFGGLNRMGGGGGTNGLVFDVGFAPDYWIGTTAGGSPATNNVAFYANYAVLLNNGGGPGYYMGTANPTNSTLTGGTNPFGVRATVNNLNTLGVDGNGCFTNSLGATQSVAAATVMTGMELAIPLSAVSSGAVTSVRVCVFLNGQGHDFISNQLLPPIATNDCFGSIGEPRGVNFGTLPGTHYFTVPIVGCNYAITPTSALYPATGGSGSVAMTAATGCGWAATSQVAWVTITSGASGSGNGTVNYSVGTNTTAVGRTGTIIIGGQTIAINQYGQPLAITIDGTATCADYGPPLAVQQLGTGYGDNSMGETDFANGSELDAAYGIIQNGVLYIVLAGDLESNFNKLNLFFETGPGGQNTLTTNYPSVSFNGLNRMGTDGNGATNGTPGLTFDADFAPNYWMGVNCGGAPFAVFADYAQLTPGGSNGYYLGSTIGSTNGTLFGGTNPFGIQAAINNTNTLGVTGSGCYDDPTLYLQGTVTNGVEIGIPLSALGSPTGTVKVCAFVSSPDYGNLSNQILGPLGTNDPFYCQGNLNEPSALNLSTLPGRHYFVVGPEMRITRIQTVATNAVISFVTAANTNLAYRVQRTSVLTTSTAWSNATGLTNGNGGVISMTILNGATNRPAQFYRVQQRSNWTCP
jgi:hypothetical protein